MNPRIPLLAATLAAWLAGCGPGTGGTHFCATASPAGSASQPDVKPAGQSAPPCST